MVPEAVVDGVITRRVDELVEALGLVGLSKREVPQRIGAAESAAV